MGECLNGITYPFFFIDLTGFPLSFTAAAFWVNRASLQCFFFSVPSSLACCLHILAILREVRSWSILTGSYSNRLSAGYKVNHDSLVRGWMYRTVCPLHGPGSIPGNGRVFQGIFPWLITLCQPVLNQRGKNGSIFATWSAGLQTNTTWCQSQVWIKKRGSMAGRASGLVVKTMLNPFMMRPNHTSDPWPHAGRQLAEEEILCYKHQVEWLWWLWLVWFLVRLITVLHETNANHESDDGTFKLTCGDNFINSHNRVRKSVGVTTTTVSLKCVIPQFSYNCD